MLLCQLQAPLRDAPSHPPPSTPSTHSPVLPAQVLAAGMARKDVAPRLVQAYSLLRADGHLVACWNDRWGWGAARWNYRCGMQEQQGGRAGTTGAHTGVADGTSARVH